jgi:hypothetical protein
MEVQAMDWKGLVQFALMGNGSLEQYAILLVRVSIGLFFAISGANKSFFAGGTKPVYDTLVQAKIPFPTSQLISCRLSSFFSDRWWPSVFFPASAAWLY